jgi:hypothetical protein
MEDIMQVSKNDINRMMQDITLIKDMLLAQQCATDSEGKLSDWAKQEWEGARKTPENELINMEEIEREFLENAV